MAVLGMMCDGRREAIFVISGSQISARCHVAYMHTYMPGIYPKICQGTTFCNNKNVKTTTKKQYYFVVTLQVFTIMEISSLCEFFCL